MNEKEISEIRKRFRPDKSNITRIRGCYVNERKEIVSEFDQSIALMTAEECEEIFGLMKKTLSGSLNRNLIDISFTNNQVLDSDEHRLLTALKTSALSDDDAFHKLTNKIIGSLQFDESYIIVIAYDKYDVPSFGSDGTKKEDSQEIYSYVLCSICPVKMTKPVLGYKVSENKFRDITPDWFITRPILGFLFPAFDGRRTNIYDVLYYSSDVSNNHPELIEELFKAKAPMPATEQKQSFSTVLRDSIAEECSYDVVKSVHDKLSDMIEEHKAVKDPDPLVISKNTVRDLLEDCGVTEERVEKFSKEFDEVFGERAEIAPRNIADTKQFTVKAPDISIRMTAEGSNLFETRVIDGQKYILIRADGVIEVNGTEISITE